MSVHPINNNNGVSNMHPLNTHQILTNDNFYSHINDPNFFSIATHNVRSCVSNIKMNQIEQFFTTYNLDILGLSETHLNTTQALYRSKNFHNKPYKFIFSSNNPKNNYQGVGFIIRSYLQEHIFFQEFLFDRIAYIDMQFKNKTKLRIIQIYLPANTTDKDQLDLRTTLENTIIKLIIKAQSKAYHVILMGDFNINFYKIQAKHNSTKRNRTCRSFIDKLLNLNFIHTASLLSDKCKKLPHTFTSTKKTHTHIDYIFTSPSLSHDLTSFKIFDPSSTIYESDHLPLHITIYKNNIFHNSSNAYRKQHKITRQSFNFDKTARLHWALFSDKLDKLIKDSSQYRNCIVTDLSFSQTALNKVWEFFVQSITCAANKHIPKYTSTLKHKPLYCFDNSAIYKQIKKIYRTYYKIKLSFDKNDTPSSLSIPFFISLEEHSNILKIANEHHISSASLDSIYYQRNLLNYFQELKASIIKPLECKLKIVSKKENNERIKEFITKRMDNFKDAPSKMIDSCLERSRQTIVLDRLLINEPNNDPFLELDPCRIKEATTKHFQIT